MKKGIFIAALLLSGSISFAQKQEKHQPPPPPPVTDVKEVVPPPPPKPPSPPVKHQNILPEDYRAFLKRNPDVKGIAWSDQKIVHIHLKSGSEEVYDMNKQEDVKNLENKYGKLPVPPPPPPVPKTPEIQ